MYRVTVFVVMILFLGIALCFAQEAITITTFYPSPYGVYRELRAQRQAIGETYYDSSQYCWSGGNCPDPKIDANADLVVEGNVGIGTWVPDGKLNIFGGSIWTTNGWRKGLRLDGTSAIEQGGGGTTMFGRGVSGNKLYYFYTGTETGAGDSAHYYMVVDDSGRVGIGTTNPGSYRLYVNGTAYSTGGWQSSDLRYKKNIRNVRNALAKILQVRGVSFEWDKEKYPNKNFPEGRHYGVIAQEIEKIFPEIVGQGPDGEKVVAYNELIPILIEALKEQQKEIDELKAQLNIR